MNKIIITTSRDSGREQMKILALSRVQILLKGLVDLSILKMENKYRIIPSIKMALFKIISGTHSIKMINSLEGLVHML